jgi:hypothetical protein
MLRKVRNACNVVSISLSERGYDVELLDEDTDITFDTLYSIFIKYSYEEYDMLIMNALKKDSIKEKHKLQIDFFSHFMCGITKAIQGINAVNSNITIATKDDVLLNFKLSLNDSGGW